MESQSPSRDLVVDKSPPAERTAPKLNMATTKNGTERTEYLLDRNLHKSFPVIVSGKGNYL
jgi:hypothetical protein